MARHRSSASGHPIAEDRMAVSTRARPHLVPDSPRLDDGKGSPSLRRRLVLIDAVAVATAWAAAFVLLPPAGERNLPVMAGSVAAVTAATLMLLRWARLYQARICASRLVEWARLAKVAAASGVVVLLLPTLDGRRWTSAALGAALVLAFAAVGRGFFDAWVRAERTTGRFTRSVVLVGRGRDAERVAELIEHHPELGYRVCGLIGDRDTARRLGLQWSGSIDNAAAAAAASGAGGVLLAATDLGSEELASLVSELLARGLHVQVSTGLWRVDERRLLAAPVGHVPFFYLEPASLSPGQLRLKRLLDLSLATAILVLGAPLLILAALAVKLSDRGPVLFRQTRVGRDGAPFTVLKFRTMRPDAERMVMELAGHNERHGPLFKMDGDPRVTAVGRILRATSIDELPQLFNVLNGTMSLVGPRPALPEEVAQFDDAHLARHRLPPGLTGLWQVEARENPSFFAYRHLDLYYVENWSCALDLAILAATVPTLATRAVRCLSRRSAGPVEAPEYVVEMLAR
jgi:exopolysaccharide biosynthesis polyprenyl glycosylphosphotransferase